MKTKKTRMERLEARLVKMETLLKNRTAAFAEILKAKKPIQAGTQAVLLAKTLERFGCHKQQVANLLKLMDLPNMDADLIDEAMKGMMADFMPFAVVKLTGVQPTSHHIVANTPIIITETDGYGLYWDRDEWASSDSYLFNGVKAGGVLKAVTGKELEKVFEHLADGEALWKLEELLVELIEDEKLSKSVLDELEDELKALRASDKKI